MIRTSKSLSEIERLDIGAGAQVGGCACENGEAIFEYGRAVGVAQRDGGVLLGHRASKVVLAVKLPQGLKDVLHDQRREPHGRFVQHQQPRPGQQRASDRRHLLLAPGCQARSGPSPGLQAGKQRIDPLQILRDLGSA